MSKDFVEPKPKSSPLWTPKELKATKRAETIRRADGAYRYSDESVFVSKAQRDADEQQDAG